MLICSHKTPPYEVRVFRFVPKAVDRTEDDEGIEIHGCAEGVYHPARRGWHPGRGDLSEGRDQPGHLLQLEEAFRQHDDEWRRRLATSYRLVRASLPKKVQATLVPFG